MNRTFLVIGYGSLLSGYGLLAERRGGRSRLEAHDIHPAALSNARRGLAKPSSHGDYLAMDLEPIDPALPIAAHAGPARKNEIGVLLLEFDRKWARAVARREEYDPDRFEHLIALADRAGKTLGEFLLAIAQDTQFSLAAYRGALRAVCGYTSPGYIFHPVPLDDGRVAVVAIGSGYDSSGDATVVSRRRELGMDRLLTLAEALSHERLSVHREGQIGYFAECMLGGMHGIDVADLLIGLDMRAQLASELASRIAMVAAREREHFLSAGALDHGRYRTRFSGTPIAALRALLKLAGVG
ncbi:MAG TPA: hypothetical protein VEF03_10720 [Candidatus Binataceae bacterium]|nr:hypothetical protein [Candidatus Binataceae bacterium]